MAVPGVQETTKMKRERCRQKVSTLLFVSSLLTCMPRLTSQLPPCQVQVDISKVEKDHYIAAVVEHVPAIIHQDFTHLQIMMANLRDYNMHASYAAQHGADIIVFPENGLDYARLNSSSPAFRLLHKYHPAGQIVPNPAEGQYNPCTNTASTDSQVLQSLSCIAKENNIYLVANLPEKKPCKENELNHPSGRTFIYNTNVAFDRQGNLVARYRKYNVYLNDFDKAPEPEYISFCTDFGVRIGTFTCFDILWDVPAVPLIKEYGVQDIAFPTQWVDELPFCTAPLIQQGTSWSLDINLLASGTHIPRMGSVGSGIYGGAAGFLNYTYNPSGGSEVLIAQVKKKILSGSDKKLEILPPSENKDMKINAHIRKQKNNKTCFTEDTKLPESFYLKEDLHKYSSMMLDPNVHSAQLCYGQLCCQLEYTVTGSAARSFRLISYQGMRTVGGGIFNFYIEVCAIVHCSGSSINECGQIPENIFHAVFEHFHLSGNFSAYDIIPVILDHSLQLIPSRKIGFTREVLPEDTGGGNTISASMLAVDKLCSPLSLALYYVEPEKIHSSYLEVKNPLMSCNSTGFTCIHSHHIILFCIILFAGNHFTSFFL